MAEMDKIGQEHAAIGSAKNAAHESGDTGGFLSTAINNTRLIVGSGALGKAPLKAGDEAFQKFHGPGPNNT